ncbi:DUF6545 domain-containing protein [Nocardia sp. NBC_01377]|uniref:DUF6545 domain-containing protein n=1 Tax=Nocardia sp. NBC_01377 TaxID=2903595 RepID=UPI00386B862F
MIPLLIFVAVVAVARLTLVHSSTGERHINKLVALATATALLREPAIAARVAPVVPGGAPTLYTVWHALFVLMSALFVGLFLLWDRGLAQYRKPQRRVVLLACAIGVALFVVAEPARRAGMSIPEAGGWRYAVYCSLTAALLVGFCVCNSRPVLMLRTQTQKERLVVLFLYVAACGTTLVSALMACGAMMRAAGMSNLFTDFAHLNGSCELLLPLLFLGHATLVPSVLRSAAKLARLDPDSRALRRLYPVWRDLTAAVPGVVLELNRIDRRGATTAEHLHRHRVEIMDAAAIVGHYTAPLPDAVDELIENSESDEDEREDLRRVLELAAAAWRLKAVGGVHHAGDPLIAQYCTPDLKILAELWESAKELMEQATAHELNCPTTQDLR